MVTNDMTVAGLMPSPLPKARFWNVVFKKFSFPRRIMGCINGNLDDDMKQLRFLLGTVKFANGNEMKIYTQATLFKNTITTRRDSEEANSISDGYDQNACVGQQNDTDNNTALKAPVNSSLDTNGILFIPLECTSKALRVQQTFNMWKAPLDIGWKFRRMKKRRTIALQPLDTFPEFVHKFRFKGQEISFFSFLQNFTKIYFYGFNVDILDPIDMTKAKWNITSR